MKPIKTTATVALMALSPIAAQAAMPVPVPMTAPAPAVMRDIGQVQPVFLDMRQLERDLALLLRGNGGGSRDWSRDGNGDDSNGGWSRSDDSNGDNSNGGNSGGGNGGNS